MSLCGYNTKEVDACASDFLIEDRLREVCGKQDLCGVKQLQLIVDSQQISLDNLIDNVPSIERLVLDYSCVHTFRDFGTSTRKLKMISLAHCKIYDLDGINTLTNLIELRLAHNDIQDLTPLAMHETLQIADLSHNQINSVVACEMLGTCSFLYSLDMRMNPISQHTPHYRQLVCYHIPQLQILEGKHVGANEGRSMSESMLASASQVHQRQTMGNSHLNEMKPKLQPEIELFKEHYNPQEAQDVDSPRQGENETLCYGAFMKTSNLTHGAVTISGNTARSLMNRRALNEQCCTISIEYKKGERRSDNRTQLEFCSNKDDNSTQNVETLPQHKCLIDGLDVKFQMSSNDCKKSVQRVSYGASNTTNDDNIHHIANAPTEHPHKRLHNNPNITIKQFLRAECDNVPFERIRLSDQRRSRRHKKAKTRARLFDFDSEDSTDLDEEFHICQVCSLFKENSKVTDTEEIIRLVPPENSDNSSCRRTRNHCTCVANKEKIYPGKKSTKGFGLDIMDGLESISRWVEECDEEIDAPRSKHIAQTHSLRALTHDQLSKICQNAMEFDNSGLINPGFKSTYKLGPANGMSNKDLIRKLRCKPKDVPEMKTKESFRRFFAGIRQDRMEYLLRAANSGGEDCLIEMKVAKRLALIVDLMTT